jgi:hypothetical protein
MWYQLWYNSPFLNCCLLDKCWAMPPNFPCYVTFSHDSWRPYDNSISSFKKIVVLMKINTEHIAFNFSIFYFIKTSPSG